MQRRVPLGPRFPPASFLAGYFTFSLLPRTILLQPTPPSAVYPPHGIWEPSALIDHTGFGSPAPFKGFLSSHPFHRLHPFSTPPLLQFSHHVGFRRTSPLPTARYLGAQRHYRPHGIWEPSAPKGHTGFRSLAPFKEVCEVPTLPPSLFLFNSTPPPDNLLTTRDLGPAPFSHLLRPLPTPTSSFRAERLFQTREPAEPNHLLRVPGVI